MLGTVSNAPFGSLCASVNAVSHGTALHKDDGMVPVLASDGRGQAEDILRAFARLATSSKLAAER